MTPLDQFIGDIGMCKLHLVDLKKVFKPKGNDLKLWNNVMFRLRRAEVTVLTRLGGK